MHLGLNRATLVYATVFSIFTVGIWAILDFGNSHLTALRDLAGHWTCRDGLAGQSAAFSIDQSGEFVRFDFGNEHTHIDTILTLNPGQTGPVSTETLRFDGDGWHVVATGNKASDDLKFSFEGPKGAAVPATGTYRRQSISSPVAPASQSAR